MNDSSGNAFNGTWYGTGGGTQTSVGTCTTASTAWGNGVTGKFNSSLNFDGSNDYITIPDNPSLEILGSWTVSLWLYPNSVTGDHNLFQPAGSSATNFWTINTSGTEVRYTNNNVADFPSSGFGLSTGQWIQITIVKSGSVVYFYKNSSLISTASSVTEPASFSSGGGIIGARSESSSLNYYYNGQIDDIRIYNYALTTAQAKLLYNQGGSVRFGPSQGLP